MFEKAFATAACQRALKAIADGDKSSLAIIYDTMSRQIYSVALSVLKNHADAEDALQNTLCEILRCAQSYKGGNPRSWILSIARNQALIIIRKRKNEIPLDNEDFTDRNSPENHLIYIDALSILNENEREAVMLKIYCGCKHKEIAEILGISVSASEKLYQRGIAKLKQYYREESPK